jgi:hypothetical protein
LALVFAELNPASPVRELVLAIVLDCKRGPQLHKIARTSEGKPLGSKNRSSERSIVVNCSKTELQ